MEPIFKDYGTNVNVVFLVLGAIDDHRAMRTARVLSAVVAWKGQREVQNVLGSPYKLTVIPRCSVTVGAEQHLLVATIRYNRALGYCRDTIIPTGCCL